MKTHRWNSVRARVLSPDRRARVDAAVEAELLELNLQALRELIGKTQAEVAELAKMSQSEVSRAEHRENLQLATLRRVVEALGGELEVRAVFDDKTVRLSV
jgi:DNA-binding phage protein